MSRKTMVCGRVIVFFCTANATTKGSPDGTMSAGGTERSCSGSGRTRCLFLGRPSGFGTAGVEVMWAGTPP